MQTKKDKRLGDEERILFGEAFDLYCVAKEEKQLTSTLEKMAQLWENLSTMKSTRYPKSLQAIVCQNNLACICLQFFSRTHPRWLDASGNLEACSNTLYSFLEELTSRTKEAMEKEMRNEMGGHEFDNTNEHSIAVTDMYPTEDTSHDASSGVSGVGNASTQQQHQQHAHGSSTSIVVPAMEALPIVTMIDGSNTPGIKKSGTFDTPVGTGRGDGTARGNNIGISSNGEKVFPRVVLGVPEAQLSPIILILQNHVSYIRRIAPTNSDGEPIYSELTFRQRRWMERNQNMIIAMIEQLPDNEKDRVYNGIAKSVNHIPVLVTGNITEELNKTTEELRARELIEMRRLEELRQKQEAEAAAEAQRKLLESQHHRMVTEEELAMLNSERLGGDGDGDALLNIEMAIQRDDKAKRYQKQREKDKITRERVSKQRAKLYAMIRTDEISKVFKAHAKSVSLDGDDVIHWGVSQEELKQTEVFERA